MLWTALFTLPLMAGVQNICSRLGIVAGQGIAGILREFYPRWVLYPAVALLVAANIINVGADLGAIADAIGVLTGVHSLWLVPPIGLGLLALQVFGAYRLLDSVLKVLTLSLFAYVVDVLVIRPPLGETLRATVVPTISFDRDHLAVLVAILGTTISPYLFFWQASHEVEEQKQAGKRSKEARRARTSRAELRYATIDVNLGMAFSNVVFYFIVLATATTLFAAGQHGIASAADAAAALRPVAGDLAGLVFAAGMVGTGLLAIPVLSGSAAFAVAEAFGWRSGLDARVARARGFYAVIAGSTFIGVLLNFSPIKPMEALFVSAVLNGIAAPPLLVIIVLAARDPRVMKDKRIGPLLTGLGWAAAVAMFAALIGLAITTAG